MANSIPTIRVAMPHAALPKYRVPVFRELSRRPGLRIKLLYGQAPNLPNVTPEGFDGEPAPIWYGHLGSHPLYWQKAHWRYTDGEKADVVVLEWNVHYASLIPALMRARANGVGTVLWGHGYSKHEAAWRRWLRDRVGRLGDCLVFYNRTTARSYIDAGWDPKRIYVALNSLDQTPIQAARRRWLDDPDRLAAFQREHGLLPGPVLLFVSRLEEDNRVEWLLEAGKRLLPRYPGLRILIVGKGPDEARLRGIAAKLELGDHARFLGAIYEDMDLAPWALSSRIFCYPANIGLSILHAFGFGLPVITSDLTEAQNPEIEALRPEVNGLVYRHGDIDALAASLVRVIEDPALAGRMSENALATVTSEFTITRMVDGLEAAIRYAWSQSSRSGR